MAISISRISKRKIIMRKLDCLGALGAVKNICLAAK
jgi:magnesium-transporting ATPase (P-type)